MGRSIRYGWYLLLLSGSVGLGVVTALDRDAMEAAFARGSFYILVVMVLAWLHAVTAAWYHHHPSRRAALGRMLLCLVPAVALNSVIFLTVPPELRVLNDESQLLGTSKSLAETHRAELPFEAQWTDSGIKTVAHGTVKRPLLFPFLTAAVHLATGYRPGNVFVVNYLASVVFFALLADVFVARWSWAGALAALLLVAAQPVVSLCAASGGFEFLQLPLVALVLTSLARYLRDGLEVDFRALVMNLILLMNVRYEGFLYAAIVLVAVRVLRPPPRRAFLSSWVYAVLPLLVLPTFWQRVLLAKRVREQLPPGMSLFSLGHLADHTLIFLRSLARFDLYLPYATPVNIVGLVALAALLGKSMLGRWRGDAKWSAQWAAVVALVGAAYWALMTSYWWSEMTDAVCSRFYLIACAALSVAAAWGLLRCLPRRKGHAALAVSALIVLAVYHPVAMGNEFFRDREGFARNEKMITGYLPPPDTGRYLVISQFPYRYLCYGYAAMSTIRANRAVDRLSQTLADGRYDGVFVIQEFKSDPVEPYTLRDRIGPQLVLRTVFEAPTRSDAFLRISRLTAVQEPPAEEPAVAAVSQP